MVDSFSWQNVSAPKGPSSVARKGTKQIMIENDLFCLACKVGGEGDMNRVAAKAFQSNICSNNSKYDVECFDPKVFVNCRVQGLPLSTLYSAVDKDTRAETSCIIF